MGRKARLKRERLRVGEVVELRDRLGVLPQIVCKVASINDDMLWVSVGKIEWGVNPKMVEVIRRGLGEPKSWLQFELKFLKRQVERCDCEECLRLWQQTQAEVLQQANAAIVN